MAFYQIKDNSGNSLKRENISDDEFNKDLDVFRNYSNKTIKNLCENNPNLIIFPNDNYTKDRIEDLPIFSITSDENPKIISGNIMGFVGSGKTQLSITSRFASQEDDYFLHYMLSKVLHLNIVDFSANSSNDKIFNLMIYLFPKFLENALRQGLYKEYKTNHYNDSNVRGVIEINRHIKNNIPFNGKVAYKTREYSYDNNVTELIRHTIEYLKSLNNISKLLSANSDVQEAVEKIISITPSYDRNARQKVIVSNIKNVNHSYFTEYLPLQKLCLMILQHKMQKFGNSKKEIYGVLFDGAWLWEEYLATLLKPEFKHPENKTGKGGIYLFQENNDDTTVSESKHSRCRRYPDFYRENKAIVLDAKYKHLDRTVPREDLYQIISYMHVLSSETGGFIYPNDSKDFDVDSFGTLKGKGGDVNLYGLGIPQNVKSYGDFCKVIEENEKKLRKKLDVE